MGGRGSSHVKKLAPQFSAALLLCSLLSSALTANLAWVGSGSAARVTAGGQRASSSVSARDTNLAYYPPLDFQAFDGNVELLHQEPPVWRIHNFLDTADCKALIEEGRAEQLPGKVYEGSFVVFDEERTKPLVLLAPLCAGAAYHFHNGDVLAALGGFVAALAMIAVLKEVVRWYLAEVASSGGRGGARFTGRKWQLGPPLESTAQGARSRLLQRVQGLCKVPNVRWLEPPFLTRYRLGEGQEAHLDSKERPPPEAATEVHEAFMATGGQRMVQCLCYLNDVDVNTHGGATHFLKKEADFLRVEPRAGSALVFCTAFADGKEDTRMVHYAEALTGQREVEKWIVPVWSLEGEHDEWQRWAKK